MIYYSTGKSSHFPKVGATVEIEDLPTAQVLIKKGIITDKVEVKPKKVK